MDSEPVFTLEVERADYKGQKLGNHFGFITLDAARELKEGNYQLYTAQPAPVVEREPIAWLNDAYLARGVVDGEAGSEDAGPGYIPVYREAGPQPAPVVPENCVTAEHRRVIEMLLNVCGVAFELADDSCQQDVDGEDCHVVPDDAFQKLSDALDEIENTLPTEDIDRPDVFLAWSAMPRAALKSILQPGNSPVIPDGWKMVPIDATRAMIDAARRVEEDGYDAMHKAMLAAAPQLPGSEPATVPGKWIPVSEHLPKEKGVYQVWNGKYVDNVPFWFGSFQSLHSELITHWMPLPAAPQEVNRE
ncbi:DUF551 domain-containing protein [Klebsiella pneumoniae]|nr:DUF551 domain-containing protein [Klebsiella pneumoniae]MCP6209815.1 DUF551 domain-containing protein [Klebsiella pneumoniae]